MLPSPRSSTTRATRSAGRAVLPPASCTANGDPAGKGKDSIANRSPGIVLDGGGMGASLSTAKQWTWQQNNNPLWTFDAVA
jgi:hypothetical protein